MEKTIETLIADLNSIADKYGRENFVTPGRCVEMLKKKGISITTTSLYAYEKQGKIFDVSKLLENRNELNRIYYYPLVELFAKNKRITGRLRKNYE